jgi:hypothetical protein
LYWVNHFFLLSGCGPCLFTNQINFASAHFLSEQNGGLDDDIGWNGSPQFLQVISKLTYLKETIIAKSNTSTAASIFANFCHN